MKKQSVFQNKAKADDQKARLSRLREEWKAFPAALGLACVCVLLGKLLPIREDWMYRILWICDCAAIILCYLATWLLLRRINKKYNDRKLPEFHASLMEKQQEVEANLEKAAARVERRLQFAWVMRTFFISFAPRFISSTLIKALSPWITVSASVTGPCSSRSVCTTGTVRRASALPSPRRER